MESASTPSGVVLLEIRNELTVARSQQGSRCFVFLKTKLSDVTRSDAKSLIY